MKRLVTALLAVLLLGCGDLFERGPGGAPASGTLTIYSTTDTSIFAPVVADFRRLHPRVAINYVELEAAPLYRRYLDETADGRPTADLLLSSAMDLQVKLVNDGFAAPHRSPNSALIPNWAKWRNEAFGFTFEPAVMVFNSNLTAGRAIPRSRPQLIRALADEPGFWRGRVGTYDLSTSSVGYLLASQDIRQSDDFAALAALLRQAGVVTVATSSELLDRIERGEIALGYNVLGSYAHARLAAGAQIEIVYPEDYTLAVTRTAVIPRNAPHPAAAQTFLNYLLSIRGQMALAHRSRLSAVRPEIAGRYSRLGISEETVGPLRPIALGPGLLVYLDRQKRERLLASWHGQAQEPLRARTPITAP